MTEDEEYEYCSKNLAFGRKEREGLICDIEHLIYVIKAQKIKMDQLLNSDFLSLVLYQAKDCLIKDNPFKDKQELDVHVDKD